MNFVKRDLCILVTELLADSVILMELPFVKTALFNRFMPPWNEVLAVT